MRSFLFIGDHLAPQRVTSTTYFLADALGSVRQLTNASGAVTLARSYQPYGSVMSSAGSGTTIYGFTGEGFLLGAGFAAYVGDIIGFRYEPGDARSKQILNDYSGEFNGFYAGISVTVIKPVVGVTAGVGYFQSPDGSISLLS